MGVWAVVTVFFVILFLAVFLVANYVGSGDPKSPFENNFESFRLRKKE